MAVSKINCSTQDYDTLTLWEDDKDGDLVGDTRQETAEVYDDDGVITENDFVIDGSTTSSDYYMKITVPSADRHNGTPGGGGATLQVTVWGNSHWLMQVLDDYTVVEWLNFKHNKEYSAHILIINATDVTAHDCIMWADLTSPNYKGDIGIFISYNGASNTLVYNMIVYNSIETAFRYHGGTNSKVYNCSFFGNTYGVYFYPTYTSGLVLTNNIIHGGTDDYWDGYFFGCTGATNITGGDNPYGNPPGNITTSQAWDGEIFVSNTDMHLVVGSDAIDAGTDLSGTFTTDIDETTRSGTWDIGADEYSAVGESSSIKTFNGLAKSSVNTFNGTAIAAVKTYNGVA